MKAYIKDHVVEIEDNGTYAKVELEDGNTLGAFCTLETDDIERRRENLHQRIGELISEYYGKTS